MQFPYFSPLDCGFPCDPFSNIKPQNVYGLLFSEIGKGMCQNAGTQSFCRATRASSASLYALLDVPHKGRPFSTIWTKLFSFMIPSHLTADNVQMWIWCGGSTHRWWWCYTQVVIEASKLLNQNISLKSRIWRFLRETLKDDFTYSGLQQVPTGPNCILNAQDPRQGINVLSGDLTRIT